MAQQSLIWTYCAAEMSVADGTETAIRVTGPVSDFWWGSAALRQGWPRRLICICWLLWCSFVRWVFMRLN